MEKIAFLGGNGFAIELYEYMKHDGIEVAGYYAPAPDTMSKYIPYLGNEREGFDRECSYVVACGFIGLRRKLIDFIDSNELKPYTYISRNAYVSSIANIGDGAAIVPNTVVSGDPEIGRFLVMNAFSMVAHQSVVGENVVLSPGVKITGGCTVGDNVLFGSNAALIPGTKIQSGAEVGIGAVPKRLVRSGKYIKAPSAEVIDLALLRGDILK